MIEGPVTAARQDQGKVDKEMECATRLLLHLGAASDRYRLRVMTTLRAPLARRVIRLAWGSMLCYVTTKEHLGLPNQEDVKQE